MRLVAKVHHYAHAIVVVPAFNDRRDNYNFGEGQTIIVTRPGHSIKLPLVKK